MTDPETSMLHQENADIRRELEHGFGAAKYFSATETAEIRRELAKEANDTHSAVVAAGQKVQDKVADSADRAEVGVDRVINQTTAYYIAAQQNATDAARDIASLKSVQDAMATRFSFDIASAADRTMAAAALAGEKNASAAALAGEKTASAIALGQAMLAQTIVADGNATRALINDHKYHDLNRVLVERNAELVEERESRRHWSQQACQMQNQGQWAAMQSQLQAFASQLQDVKQGTVNFGTMSGNAGRNQATNNVA